MGVERKNANLSLLGSFFMVIFAGTVYRFSSMNRKIFSSKVSDLL